ncbi:protein ADM2 [Cavia porcellus]|uniref:protein ADM2 n=1 Tax=Cavia porcellus TaxID=10141 RepID=UPI000661E758|nr:ADM2 [Cavia porcellus]
MARPLTVAVALGCISLLHLQLPGACSRSLRRNFVPPDGGQRHPGPRQHLGLRRPFTQLLRVGCGLGTCLVQKLSHRLWQLAGPAGWQDSASVDPRSPHSYG